MDTENFDTEIVKCCIWLSIDTNGVYYVADVASLGLDCSNFVRDANDLTAAGWSVGYVTHDGGFTDFKAVKETTAREAMRERDAYAPGRTMDIEEDYGV